VHGVLARVLKRLLEEMSGVAEAHRHQIDRELLVEELLVRHAVPRACVIVVRLLALVPLVTVVTQT
jgi:hypothetical protein